jgi:hypothetical protein
MARICDRRYHHIESMNRKKTSRCFAALLVLGACPVHAAEKNEVKAWTDPDTARKEDPDFLIQGEYGSLDAGASEGVQVVALGDGSFDAYLLKDGLPGLGWTEGKTREVLKGTRIGNAVTFVGSDPKIAASILDGKFHLTGKDGAKFTLPRIERHSPTLGMRSPSGALVLFDGSSTEHWEKGKVENGHLLATGCTSKHRFDDYMLHLEFRTPYMPKARGQGRGNSGVYYAGRWETQILDSFGLDSRDNHCGGIYSISKPRLNMCLPPLTWQTYDVDFTAAKFDAEGKRTAWPRITVKLNGVLVHEDLELNKDLPLPLRSPIHSMLPRAPCFCKITITRSYSATSGYYPANDLMIGLPQSQHQSDRVSLA